MKDISVQEEDRLEEVAEDIEDTLESEFGLETYGHLIPSSDLQEMNRNSFDGAETEAYVNVTHEVRDGLGMEMFDFINGTSDVSDKADVNIMQLPESRTMGRGTSIFGVVL